MNAQTAISPSAVNSSLKTELSPQAREELKTQWHRVQLFATARLMWQRLLTAAERSQLGANLDRAFRRQQWRKTIGMWTEVRGGSDEEALLEIALNTGHLSRSNYEWLRREMGLPLSPQITPPEQALAASTGTEAPAKSPVPCWDKTTGQLQFQNRPIRNVRVMGQPTNIQHILDAFEAQAWPPRIDNPLPGDADQHQLHQTLQSLNRGLQGIRFHASEGGRTVFWQSHEFIVNS